MKKKLFSWLAMFCFIIPCMFGLSACTQNDPTLTNYKVIVNQQLVAESRSITVVYGDEIEWSAIAIYDDNSTTAIAATDVTIVDEDEVIGTTPVVGEYQIKFKYSTFNEYVVTVNVAPKALVVPTANNLVYTGEAQTTELVGFDENTMTVSGNLTATNADTYSVEVALKDTTNYRWADGSTQSQTVEYIVSKAKVAKPTKVEKTYTYTGEVQTLELVGFDANSMSITGNTATNAGNYTAVVTLEDTNNYEWKNGVDSNIEWSIKKAQGTAPSTAPTALVGTYDAAKTLADYNLATGYTWADETIIPEVAQTEYEVIYNPDSQNYTDYEMTITLNLARAKLTVPSVDTTEELAYDGLSKTVVLAGYNSTLMNVSGNSAIEVGSHTAVVTITNGNYEFVDGTTLANVVWNIDKGTPTLSISYDYSKPYDGLIVNLPRYEMPELLEQEVLAIDDGVNVAYFDADGDSVAYEELKEAGTYKMTLSTVETAHYKAASVEQTFQIYYYLPILYNNNIVDVDFTEQCYYDGTAQTPEFTVKRNFGTSADEDWQTLVAGKDYTFEYFNNIDFFGSAYVNITGKGEYAGVIKYYFYIYPQYDEILSSVTVAGKTPVEYGNQNTELYVTVPYNAEGYEIALNVADLYEDVYDNGGVCFSWSATTLRQTYIAYKQPISNDTLKFTVPANTKTVEIFYNDDSVVIDFEIWTEDEIHNVDYLAFSGGAQVWAHTTNIWSIYANATGSAEEVIREAFTNQYYSELNTNYYVLAETLSFSGTTVSIQLQNKTDVDDEITLTYEIIDPRSSYIEFIEVKFDNNSEIITEFDANKTITVEVLDLYASFSACFSTYGNLYKAEFLFNGEILDEDGENGGTTSSIYYSSFEENGAGTYTLRLYTSESVYVDYYVVIESFEGTGYFEPVKITYDDNVYSYTQLMDGGILVKVDATENAPEYFFMYVGELETGVETINISIETILELICDSEQNPFDDWSNITLEVLTGEDGVKYAMFYGEMEGIYIPFYMYFTEAPEADVRFNFANYSLNFTYDYELQDNGGDPIWLFGDFVSLTDPEESQAVEDTKVIMLYAFVTPEDLNFESMQVDAETYIFDTTVDVDIELFDMTSIVVYDTNNQNVYSMIQPSLTDINIPVLDDGTDPYLSIVITSWSEVDVMYILNICIIA